MRDCAKIKKVHLHLVTTRATSLLCSLAKHSEVSFTHKDLRENTPTSVVEAHILCLVDNAIGNSIIDDIVNIQSLCRRSSQSVDRPTL